MHIITPYILCWLNIFSDLNVKTKFGLALKNRLFSQKQLSCCKYEIFESNGHIAHYQTDM